ncbi:hypothetical protein LINPERHAP2_LOCUS43571 [Linum perenne]
MGGCSITRTKIRGIIEGMKLAWSHGVRKLKVQSDSLCAIQILQKTTDEDHQHARTVCVFSAICCSEMRSVSQYREGNFLVYSIVTKGHGLSFGTHPVEASNPVVAH